MPLVFFFAWISPFPPLLLSFLFNLYGLICSETFWAMGTFGHFSFHFEKRLSLKWGRVIRGSYFLIYHIGKGVQTLFFSIYILCIYFSLCLFLYWLYKSATSEGVLLYTINRESLFFFSFQTGEKGRGVLGGVLKF